MKIAMFTNTYLPHVGGVAKSVATYASELRDRGHRVCVIAPEFEGADDSKEEVLRIPAIQRFNGSDFSVRLPQPLMIDAYLDEFEPDVIHSHHPFLLGDTALRVAWTRHLPIVFTHHTMYERYTHYVPLDSDAMKRVAIQMATEYCNLCTHIISPSDSIRELLLQRQVAVPITTIPTGIDLAMFAGGSRAKCRSTYGISDEALVVGHLGRLAEEKNLPYLAEAVATFLQAHPEAVWLVVGSGDAEQKIQDIVMSAARPQQLVMTGCLTGQDLIDAYAAMDLFVFSSQSETQGMVLAEAMAAGVPILALDAPGVRDVLSDRCGRMLPSSATAEEFSHAMNELCQDRDHLRRLGAEAQQCVKSLGLDVCADRLASLYQRMIEANGNRQETDVSPWDRFLDRLEIEWNLIVEKSMALAAAVVETEATRSQLD